MKTPTPTALDLDAYFQRIGYHGDRCATLETLQAIHLAHAESIAFENLTSLLQQPVPLDLPSLQHKLIHQRRGGYCFEQNLLLHSVLLTLGFQVTNLAARVLWNLPEHTLTPRSHMLLQVELEGERYLADVGFGGLTLTAPLLLTPDIKQTTPHEPFRLIASDDVYILQANIAQAWQSLYRFDLQVQQLPDYEVSNWYVSTHPQSLFVNSLIVAKPDSGCRYALRNNQLSTHYLDGHTEHKVLSTVSELRAALEELFGLQLSTINLPGNCEASPTLDRTLQRLIDQTNG